MMARPVDALTGLVLHVMAHVRLAGPGTLYDPRYVAWVVQAAPAEHVARLHEGAAILERAWSTSTPMSVHAWPTLYRSVDELRALGDAPFASLRPEQVRSPRLLEALQRLEPAPTQHVHAMLVAAAAGYDSLRRARIDAELAAAIELMAPWWEPAVALVPTLGRSEVALCHALGPRGRVYGHRIVVGAPAPWNELDPRISVVLALHEQLVHDCEHSAYARVEWAALTGLSARMRNAISSLREAHAVWLASLELAPLLEVLVGEGLVDEGTRRVIDHEPLRRAEVMAGALYRL